jgi:hypothetical protein
MLMLGRPPQLGPDRTIATAAMLSAPSSTDAHDVDTSSEDHPLGPRQHNNGDATSDQADLQSMQLIGTTPTIMPLGQNLRPYIQQDFSLLPQSYIRNIDRL